MTHLRSRRRQARNEVYIQALEAEVFMLMEGLVAAMHLVNSALASSVEFVAMYRHLVENDDDPDDVQMRMFSLLVKEATKK